MTKDCWFSWTNRAIRVLSWVKVHLFVFFIHLVFLGDLESIGYPANFQLSSQVRQVRGKRKEIRAVAFQDSMAIYR